MAMKDADPQNVLDPKILRGETARPWISPLVWAMFKAYWTIVGYVNAIAHMLKHGIDPRKFLAPEKISEFLDAALPDKAAMFRPFRPELIAAILELLELSLLIAIRQDLSGAEPSLETLEQAKRIADAAESASADIAAASPSAPPPPPSSAAP
jgi:hypothetical protein